MLSQDVRKALSRFATGVTVVTSGDELDRHGMTCNAFCSISMTPPLILVSLTKGTRTEALVARTGAFAVNVLSDAQTHVSDRFAGRHQDKETDRFEGIDFGPGATGAPVLIGIQAHLECRVERAIEAGDHVLYLGEVLDARFDEAASPLIFFESRYRYLERKQDL